MKALIFLIPEGFRDEEFAVPRGKLKSAGVSVVVAGLQPGKAHGVRGMSASPDILLDEVHVDDYDAFILPGGGGAQRHLFNNLKVHSIIKEAYSKGKVVAAICLSGAVLANAGILKDKNATVFSTPQTIKIFHDSGVKYSDKHVVVDGNIVTADGPEAAEAFADAILSLLKSK
jgi:protease I